MRGLANDFLNAYIQFGTTFTGHDAAFQRHEDRLAPEDVTEATKQLIDLIGDATEAYTHSSAHSVCVGLSLLPGR
jgi:hypothetical protein